MAVKLVATDVDGTLTLRRGVLLVSLEAIEAIRELEASGVRVSLVSGNSLPITAGLARYFGATGPSVAENGCVVFYEGKTVHLCKGRPPDELRRELLEAGFRESWQNAYRHHDLAFYPPPGYDRGMLSRIIEKYGMILYDSGYAVHIQPPGGGKDAGVEAAAKLLNVSLQETLAVGDGLNDLPMLEVAGHSACPVDADPEVKRVVDYVASKPGGRGFAEIASLVLEGRF